MVDIGENTDPTMYYNKLRILLLYAKLPLHEGVPYS